MSLRKSPTLTPARLEANRRNSRKSTGPRTARGKGQSRMNSLQTGARSRFVQNLYMALYDAPPGGIGQVARALLTPEQAAHPRFAEMVNTFQEADIALVREHWDKVASAAAQKAAEDRRAERELARAKGAPSAGPGGRRSGPETTQKTRRRNTSKV
ncbi:MAG: hypothetical protein WAO35_24175 [Terriglobia bacterium]